MNVQGVFDNMQQSFERRIETSRSEKKAIGVNSLHTSYI